MTLTLGWFLFHLWSKNLPETVKPKKSNLQLSWLIFRLQSGICQWFSVYKNFDKVMQFFCVPRIILARKNKNCKRSQNPILSTPKQYIAWVGPVVQTCKNTTTKLLNIELFFPLMDKTRIELLAILNWPF